MITLPLLALMVVPLDILHSNMDGLVDVVQGVIRRSNKSINYVLSVMGNIHFSSGGKHNSSTGPIKGIQ